MCGMRVENNQGIKSCMRVGVRGERFGNIHKGERFDLQYTANEGPVRIQYKCLVSIYVFPEIKLLFPKHVLSPSSYTRISVRDLYIFPGSVCLFCCREIFRLGI